MKAIRSALFNLLFFGVTALTVLFGLPLLAFPPRVMHSYLRAWARTVLWLLRGLCGIRLRVTGIENLPVSGPALIAAQHQSAFDTIVWHALLPRPAYVMKEELMRIPGWGAMARHVHSIPVDREGGGAALKRLVRATRAAADAGYQVVIFPEGTRSAPGEVQPWQPGFAAMASATSLPVVPVATDSGRFWGKRAFTKQPGTLTVAVLPPIPPGLPRPELMKRAEAAVAEASARLTGGVDKLVE
ncbi:lysophospholipid acyltransferase family protein [Roseomonas xinghualingensis]|uniref:lysophospholipid acyltransferase family protein n=1 Tax=Roseomonas xinghualingensis TaxID=2986475 RepID=UPI0021F1E144|nr:lysophospholipid acyltransferase family protein [Roseomonas sp. SXEYE001]MCV4205866.1 1-acyl-sn-glycerol-3-phosphate acyltransferase [Roseomonas sp. SXEYE001]